MNRLTRLPYLLKRLAHPAFGLIGAVCLSACSFGGQAATALPTVPATDSTSASPVAVTAAATTAALPAVKNTAIPTTMPTVIPTTAPKTAIPTTAVPTTAVTIVPTTAAPQPTTAIPPTTSVPNSPVPTTVAANAVTSANTESSVAALSTAAATSGVPLGSPRVLAWNKDAKQIAWYAAGASQPVLSGPAQFNSACNTNPVLPAGDKLIVYHGAATAPIQLVSLTDPSAQPTAIGDGSALSCDLRGRAAFSPDNKRLGLIKFSADSTTVLTFASGTFRVISIPDGTEQASIDTVNAFALENSGALLVHLIANSKNLADQADLGWWDAATNKERFLERGIKASDKCYFVTASVVHVADKVYTAFGENCTAPAGGAYRVLRTDFAGGNSSNWVQHTAVGGSYFSYTDTNALIVLPDNQTLLLATPNGIKGRVANLVRISIADATVTPLFQSVIMDNSPQNGPHRFQVNPQKTLLAFVNVNVNNGETLYVYDLTKPTQAPAPVTDNTRSNQITGLAWNAAGDRLVYAITGDDASINYFDVNSGKNLVTRGAFQGLMITPDGQTAATVEQVKQSATDIRYNLVTIALADGTKTVLVTGDKNAAALDVLAIR